MCVYADLVKGELYRVFEYHLCFKMFYLGTQGGKEYFGETKNLQPSEGYYFEKWESINNE